MSYGDFEAILAVARRTQRCPECGNELNYRECPKSDFCSDPCSIRFRDRRRYHENIEASRARSRDYYRRTRETVLAKAHARLLAARPDLRDRRCEECGDPLEGRKRVVCSPRCREARFKRLNPESYAKREAAKVERRREKRRGQRESFTDKGDW